jgi:hypothetical protein
MPRRASQPHATCWVDLFEDRNLRHHLRRLHGPGAYPNLRAAGAGFGLSVAGVRAGEGAYVLIFHHAAPDQPLGWLLPGETLAELTDIAPAADSLHIYDHPPGPEDPMHASFIAHTRRSRSRQRQRPSASKDAPGASAKKPRKSARDDARRQ